MPSLFDYLERSVTGPIMTQKDFQMKILIPNVRKIVNEFEIKYDPDEPVSADNDLADRLFDAAIEFLALTGLYCDGTNRVIEFDRDEIKKGLEDYRHAGTFGEGRDRSVLTPRKPEDKKLPWRPGNSSGHDSLSNCSCVFMKGAYQLSGPVDMNLGCSSTRAALWVYSVVGQAISRNTNFCVLANQYALGCPGIKTYFYEATAELLAVVTSGFAGFESCHPAKGIVKNGLTPSEAQFNAELAHSIAQSGVKTDLANELCNRLLGKYEEEIKIASAGI